MPRKRTFVVVGVLVAAILTPATALWFRDTAAGQHWLERQFEIVSHRMLTGVSADAAPVAFTTDGCSGGMSDFWSSLSRQFPALTKDVGDRLPWEHCCVSHDRAYYDAAGTEAAKASFTARITADQALRKCVSDIGLSEPKYAAEYIALSNVIYTAVRLGGLPCSGLPWRWGYGRSACFVGSQLLGDGE